MNFIQPANACDVRDAQKRKFPQAKGHPGGKTATSDDMNGPCNVSTVRDVGGE